MTFPFHLPSLSQHTVRFNAAGTWTPFVIPTGAAYLSIYGLGPGGNGGNGFTRAAAAAGGGGGGGGAGGRFAMTIPVFALPETIFINPGLAGVADTYVCASPSTTAGFIIGRGTAGGAGGNGTGAAVGAAGAAGIAPTSVNSGPYSGFGAIGYEPGIVGGAGGAVAGGAGSPGAWGTVRSPVSGGGGGGGTTSANFAGGAVTGIGLVPTLAGGLAGSNDGNAGFIIERPLSFMGGSGGGSNNTGPGGNGGKGAPGCGGGGGGAGTTGGTGGRGGNGIVFITILY